MSGTISVLLTITSSNQLMNAVMTWEQICDDPNLSDLPFKIEQDRYGRIVMSPPPVPRHGSHQSEIAHRLRLLLPGWIVITECAVETGDGVKVPDVGAMSRNRIPGWKKLRSLPKAPPICVEVLSASNSAQEIDEKRRLYAAKGCCEFWTCSEKGIVSFFDAVSEEPLPKSRLCPKFPRKMSH